MLESSEITARVARLERTNRVLIVTLLVLVVGLVVGARSQAQGEPGRVISAHAFQLTDPGGNVVAELKLGEKGPGLFIRDAEGRDRVSLTHEAEQTGLFISDVNGDTRIGIAQFAHGGGGVALHGPAAKGAAVLYLKSRGTLSFYDADGNVVHRLPEAE